jgi:Na+/H+ antiporter NhaD/arsenite permease-like protein
LKLSDALTARQIARRTAEAQAGIGSERDVLFNVHRPYLLLACGLFSTLYACRLSGTLQVVPSKLSDELYEEFEIAAGLTVLITSGLATEI